MNNYFLLPINNNNINCNDIQLKYNVKTNAQISLTLKDYLNNIKLEINNNFEKWDFVKKYTNPYEFIHTIVPNSKHSVSKYNPLSRSFYKIIEIVNILNIFDDFKNSNHINTFHLAEGPGGFIEATNYLRNNKSDKYYGMTLIEPNNNNVPGWNKSYSYLEENPNIIIEKGITGTGDLLSVDNLKYCSSKYANSMNIITADGGFDFSIDFNQQELLATNLLFAQVSFALSMQKVNGHFIIKIFDIFTKTTIDIIYLLSTLYKEVYIIKPNTSRIANSEKYIVCKYFKESQPKLINKIISEYHILQEYPYISSILNFNLDYYYINKLEEINAIFGQQQIENISTTINLINSKNKIERCETLKKNNIQKCIQWCETNNIPYNKTIDTKNIFLNK